MTEIAIDRLPQPEPELDRQRTIEAVGDAQLIGEFLRGIGRQNGLEGFEQYLEIKSIAEPA